ncbi:MAG: hypothetical protein U0Q16_04985 [Bryobacteraceae bacterium]
MKRVKPGDELLIDNSKFLAAQYYHRHQVSTPDFYVWNQFRALNGKPLYPQRPQLMGPGFAASAGGSTQSGRFVGKMIVVEALWDQDAFPWQADWYATKVKAALGPHFDENFRLWFVDHAIHGDVEQQADPTHTVSYVGALQQALRDLSAWVERGVPPPAGTMYEVADGQVRVPPGAAERRGIQPVVALKANGSDRAEVAVGQSVTLAAVIDVPPQTGRVVAAEWSLDGGPSFTAANPSSLRRVGGRVTVTAKHSFSKPGTYFPVLRAISQREGDSQTQYGRVQNLARVRVVVK